MISAVKKAGALVIAGIVLMTPFPGSALEKGASLSGSAEAGYRLRTDGENTDQDLIERLSVQGFGPWAALGEGREAGFVFAGALQSDIDGQTSDREFDPFREIADTYDQSTFGWIYLAYGEVNGPGALKLFRLGRQDSLELAPIAFDGGLITLRPEATRNFTLTALAGLPTNLYEDLNDRRGDSVVGVYGDWRALRTLSLRAGYLDLRDRVELLDGREETLKQSLAVAQAAWRPRLHDHLLGRISLQDGELRDVVLRGSHRDEERNLNVSAFYQGLYLTREAEPLTEDAFSVLLGDLHPYHQAGVTLYKGIGERLGVEAGAVVRGLRNEEDEGRFNHGYQRYLLSLFINKVPLARSELMLGADWWLATQENNVTEARTLRAEYNQRFGKRGLFRAGTAFDLYKIDEFTGEEREETQTYYTDLTIPTVKNLLLLLSYSFEDSSLREVDTFRARLRYEF